MEIEIITLIDALLGTVSVARTPGPWFVEPIQTVTYRPRLGILDSSITTISPENQFLVFPVTSEF